VIADMVVVLDEVGDMALEIACLERLMPALESLHHSSTVYVDGGRGIA
jgi:hypothetical protein